MREAISKILDHHIEYLQNEQLKYYQMTGDIEGKVFPTPLGVPFYCLETSVMGDALGITKNYLIDLKEELLKEVEHDQTSKERAKK